MPRKVNYGIDYDEDYDMYDDFDDYDDHDSHHCIEGNGYNYDAKGNSSTNGREGNGVSSQQVKTGRKSGFWTCSICTYDNDGSSLSCDMCGVLQDSSVKFSKDGMPSQQDKADRNSGIWRCPYCTYDNDGSSLSCDVCGVVQSHPVNFSKDESTGTSAPTIEVKGVIKFPPDNETPSCSSYSLPKPGHQKGIESCSITEDAEMPLANKLGNVKLDHNSTSIRKDNLCTMPKPEKWMLSDPEQGIVNQLNLAIVGHVDSGKSTLSGRLLHLLGRISKKEMHRNEKEAKQMGKGSFAYAWAMDESVEERERGITMTVAVAYFDSRNYRVVLLDSPGHKDFVSNMISGATQADAAILVVDASKGSFEAGMDGNGIGQTREHAQLIRSFGVEQIIIAVNKMDAVGFSKERFDFIKLQLGSFLRSCGFKESSITWIPLSAMENQNLVTRASDDRLLSWYQGECLLDAIDSLQPPIRDVSKPLRLPICDVIKLHSLGQTAACGKIETGAIRNGSKVLVMPSGDVGTVRSIERDTSTCSMARAGDNVAVSLHGVEWNRVIPGGVLCHPDFPVTLATSLELKILVLDITAPILVGSQVEFHVHHAKKAATVVKIISLLDPKSGKVTKNSPRILKAKQSAVIEACLDEAVCVEEFSTCRALGRAFLRSSGNTIAVGVVTKVLELGS